MGLAIIVIFVFLVLYIAHFYWNVSKYPKGPFPLPFIGNLLQFPAENIHVFYDDLAKIYGPCFTIWTPLPSIVLTDYEQIKDAFVTQETFTYRSHLPPETLFQPHDHTGLMLTDGDDWKLQRKTALKILRNFGLGKNLMEEQVIGSIREMQDQLGQIKDKSDVDLFWPIQLCVGNIINETLFGFHYKHEDCGKFQTFVKVIDTHIKSLRTRFALLVAAFPWLRNVPVVGEIGYHFMRRNIDLYHNFMEQEVASQIKTYNQEEEPTNFVHAYMREMEISGKPGLNPTNLCASVVDFWLAGMETTSNSIRWSIAYMMKYPEIQDKVRKEIQENVGSSRLPSIEDKPNLPYTQAVIHEVQRHSNMVPMLGSHKNIKDTTILGKPVPAETFIFAQLWSVMKNDSVFEDSHLFNPDRYLHSNGETFRKDVIERTIPFSIGKRNCIGEGLARMELFLIFSALIQNYEFVATSNIDLTAQWSTVLTVKPYTCKSVPQF
ncbi:hypothetical protein B9Z55_020670 [Caenorhabditis nigoni]|uniref:CYtochrome P450 family n=1 Tax=Caenorhabditis nigoni TaxID=1611254 RepID=A0A2G5TNS6_9PELO|nr:hypothetical protein B9Z55_020670 [Caenorhabditis nigoni]